ncbi:MAG TPA: DUF2232 domain-containing protein [Thermoleophilia bacterium]
MKGFSSAALADLGKATALTAVIGLGMAYLPFGAVVLTPLLPLPIAYAAMRHGNVLALVGALIAGAVVWLAAGQNEAMLVFLLAAGLGIALGTALQGRWGFAPTLALMTAATVALFVVWGVALWQGVGVTWTHIQQTATQSINDATTLYGQTGVSQTTLTTVSDEFKHIVSIAPYLAPGLIGMASVLLASCSAGLAHLIFPRMGNRIASPFSLSKLRIHWSVAYVSILGLAFLLFARGDGDWQSALRYVGIDMLLVSQTLFFLQGLAVVQWFAVARKWGRGARGWLYAAALLGQAFFQLTGLAGLFDTWVDYRKRFALKTPGTGPTG